MTSVPLAVPTATHASNLFATVMVRRFGRKWGKDLDHRAIASLADEVARGFGGVSCDWISPSSHHPDRQSAPISRWRFPDGSVVASGPDGLKVVVRQISDRHAGSQGTRLTALAS